MTRQVELYKIPEKLEIVMILDDSILESYNESIKNYNSEKARRTLSKFDKSEGELIGSSPFMNVQLIKSLPQGVRLATRSDLEKTLSFKPDFLIGNYYDFGLALLRDGDSYKPNDLLSKTLTKQLKEREIKLEKGKLIPFSCLQLVENSDSHHGLVFELNDNVTKESIQNIRDFKWDYARGNGLFRAFLDGYGGWNRINKVLGGSHADGRVVVVKTAEGNLY